ncbi:NAD-dependent epimerase/dehydratase family protein [Mesorhizobium sp. ZC-5]|uniref:NAD-dependent epimerase/dehydratase family protein n=1 Tax=Mesorhizobium sp. ZC-5 TaxID=2986066 RepID=UPI0021E805C8|nr:NAD-dependent epimerase/dehydratase family protein [Mesorhizobium sp. ZC-5]MCV3243683.1 NAD-dependent epimerase/dehydratase family protein [Mesorhizobium sp. ZC-5]
MKRILVTGASGFVGGLLVQRLRDAGFALNLAGRAARTAAPHGKVQYFAVGEVGSQTDWRPVLQGCDAVVHLAAQVPLRGVPNEAFDEVNDRGTARLVEQAAASDAKVLILLSSVFAVADNSAETPVSEQTTPTPTTPYGRSKLAAESHMGQFDGPGRIGIVLRPPIVYGAGAQGNWRLLQRLAATGVPLPFGAIGNSRTLIAAENLADAIFGLVSLPDADLKPGTYMVSDEESVSLKEILTWLRSGMGMSPRLVPVPAALLRVLLRTLGKEKIAKSLLGNLQVDSRLFRETFGWSPEIRPRQGITRSGAGFQR